MAVFAIARLFESGQEHPAPIVRGPDHNEPSGPNTATTSTKPKSVAQNAEARVAAPVQQPSVTMPEDEIIFIISAVEQGRDAFRAAPNEMAQGGTRYHSVGSRFAAV